MAIASKGFVAIKVGSITKNEPSINRARMQQALNSGEAMAIPDGLSREEMRQFILKGQYGTD